MVSQTSSRVFRRGSLILCLAVSGCLLLGILPGSGLPQASGATHIVSPDGTGDFPTIQDAINAALQGDVIALASGVFAGGGNRDVDLYGKALTITSESGTASDCIIDCQGSTEAPHRAFVIQGGETAATVIQYLTIRNGYLNAGGGHEVGGGIFCDGASPTIRGVVFEDCRAPYGSGVGCLNHASPEIVDCRFFRGRAAYRGGAALAGTASSPHFLRCVFRENRSDGDPAQGDGGGAFWCGDSSYPVFDSCTLVGNAHTSGGGLIVGMGSMATLTNTIIAFCPQGSAIGLVYGGGATLSCCDLYGNAGGDWDNLPGQLGQRGNICADPLFCNGSLGLQSGSPCAATSNPTCGLIGVAADCDWNEGPVLHWCLDDTAQGIVADASGNGQDGVCHGTAVVPGVDGFARSFNGTSDYIEVPSSSLLDLQDEVTIMMWIRIEPTANEGMLISKRSSISCEINYGIKYHYDSGRNFLAFQYGSGCLTGSNYVAQDVSNLCDGGWHHVAFAYRFGLPSSALWIVDGRERSGAWTTWSGTVGGGTARPPTITGPLRVGNQPVPSSPAYFMGALDEVQLYSRAMDAWEMVGQYLAVSPATTGGEDWETGGAGWTFFGSPQAEVVFVGGVHGNALDPNGDAWCNSGGWLPSAVLPWSPGLFLAGTFNTNFFGEQRSASSQTLSIGWTNGVPIASENCGAELEPKIPLCLNVEISAENQGFCISGEHEYDVLPVRAGYAPEQDGSWHQFRLTYVGRFAGRDSVELVVDKQVLATSMAAFDGTVYPKVYGQSVGVVNLVDDLSWGYDPGAIQSIGLDLGTVLVDGTAQRRFSLCNHGATAKLIRLGEELDQRLSLVSVGGGDLASGVAVAPDEYLVCDATFTPASEGPFSLDVRFVESGSGALFGLVSLQGAAAQIECSAGYQTETDGMLEQDSEALYRARFTQVFPDSVVLRYARGGRRSYDRLRMQQVSSSGDAATYEAILSGVAVGPEGLSQYLEVYRGIAVLCIERRTLRTRIKSMEFPAPQPAGQYCMISLPADCGGAFLSNLFGDDFDRGIHDQWRFWRFEPGDSTGYRELTLKEGGQFGLHCGRSYWLITRDALRLSVQPDLIASTNLAGSYSLVLRRGWNMIANPFAFPVALSDLRVDPADGGSVRTFTEAVDDTLVERPYGWTRQRRDGCPLPIPPIWAYTPDVQILFPFTGYWIKNIGQKDITLFIPPLEAESQEHGGLWPVREDDGDAPVFQLAVQASAGAQDGGAIVIGAREEALATRDQYDRSLPPAPPGSRSVVYLPHLDWPSFQGQYAVDMRALPPANGERKAVVLGDPEDEGWSEEWRFDVAVHAAERDGGDLVRLDVSGIRSLPPDWTAWLVDHELNRLQDLRADTGYVFVSPRRDFVKSDDAARFGLLVGTAAALADELDALANRATVTRLGTNSPNPFNPSTRIRFDVAEPCDVSIVLYDCRGRLVRELFKGRCERGGHERLWDGRDGAGRAVAAGIYFCRMRTSTGFTQTRKMALIK